MPVHNLWITEAGEPLLTRVASLQKNLWFFDLYRINCGQLHNRGSR